MSDEIILELYARLRLHHPYFPLDGCSMVLPLRCVRAPNQNAGANPFGLRQNSKLKRKGTPFSRCIMLAAIHELEALASDILRHTTRNSDVLSNM